MKDNKDLKDVKYFCFTSQIIKETSNNIFDQLKIFTNT